MGLSTADKMGSSSTSTKTDEDGILPRPDNNTTQHDHALDLEKQDTVQSSQTNADLASAHPYSSRPTERISRPQSLTRRRTLRGHFSHPLGHVKTTEESLVVFDGPDDVYNPKNWPFRKKLVTTMLYGFTTMGATFASAVFAPATNAVSAAFVVSTEVSLLGTSFLLLGFGLGPLLWGPLSEVYGRKAAVLTPYFVAICFMFATATATNIQTVLLCRFFGGLFGSAPVTNTGGVLGDIWSPEVRGTAIVGYAFAVIGGPTLAPIVGGAIVQSYLGWPWTQYITGIMMSLFLLLDVLILDETYPPVLLVAKARRLRHETGNWALHARHEEWDVSLSEMANKFGARPFMLLATPICFLIATYASFVYGIVYLMLAAIPIQFAEQRGFGDVTSELPFLGILIGAITGGGLNILNNRFYIKSYHANGGKPVPEARLPPMMLGSVFFSAGLFIFGWTSHNDVFWLAPVIGLVCLGLGFFTIFQAALNYLIDTFQNVAASAVAANTFLRSVFAAAFPLFAPAMFHNLGIPIASTVLGAISLLMLPIPYFFYVYGPRLRMRGKYTAKLS